MFSSALDYANHKYLWLSVSRWPLIIVTSSGHEKSADLCVVFKSQPSTEYPAPTSGSNVTALKMRSVLADCVENCEKLENHTILTQKPMESVISTCFSWADDANSHPISSTMPTKYLRNLSGLRSSSANPFSSLCHRGHNRK